MTAFRDTAAGADTITDPPIGTTTVTGDFASFSPGPDTPDARIEAQILSSVSTSSFSGAPTIQLPKPACDRGDQVLVFISMDQQGDNTRQPVAPTDDPIHPWYTMMGFGEGFGDGALAIFVHYPSENEGGVGAYVFTLPNGTTEATMTMIVVRGDDLSISSFGTINPASSTTHTTDPMTILRDGLLLLFHAGTVRCAYTDPSGMTLVPGTYQYSVAWSSSALWSQIVSAGSVTKSMTSSVAEPTLYGALLFAYAPQDIGYSGWLKLVLTETTRLRFDTFGSGMQDTRISIMTDPAGPRLYDNDDSNVAPYHGGTPGTWSSIPDPRDEGPAIFRNFPPGTYYIRVWPYDGPSWVFDGDAILHITREPLDSPYEIVDDRLSSNIITDPPLGETYASADFAPFTPDPSDPIELTYYSDGFFSGWIRLDVSVPTPVAFDTYGSGMIDTVVLVYFMNPDTSLALYAVNDDTREEPYYGSPADNLHSAIDIYGRSILLIPGTYYIAVEPFDGAFWDTTEGEVLLRITHTDRVDELGGVDGTGTRGTPPPAIIVEPTIPTSLVEIEINGVDVRHLTLLADAEFTAQVNGMLGFAHVSVLDLYHDQVFKAGDELICKINGVKHWGGWVQRAIRAFPFPVEVTDVPAIAPRYWQIDAVDYDVLFGRRFVFDEAHPATKLDFSYPVGTYDDTIINDIFDNYLSLAGDGLSRSGVKRVAIVTLDIKGVTSKGTRTNGIGTVASAGYQWKQTMDVIKRATGAVYYISPDKVLCYVDVETATSQHKLTDRPTRASHAKYRGFELAFNGMELINDMLLWGAGAGADRMVFSHKQDAASQLAHGRWQEGLFTYGIIHQASADLAAQSYLTGTPQSHRGHKDDRVTLSLRTYFPYYRVGDKALTEVQIFDYAAVLPVRKSTIRFVSWKQPQFDLTLGHEIDEPWSIFESTPFPGYGDYLINFPRIWFPPGIPTDGVLYGYIIDSFTRDIPDSYAHDGSFIPDGNWQQGQHIYWTLSAFFMNHHNPVTGGFGVMKAMMAHYPQSSESGFYSDAKPMHGYIDDTDIFGTPIPISHMFIKFKIAKLERLIPAEYVSSSGYGGPPNPPGSPWSDTGKMFDYNVDAWGNPEPDLTTSGGFGAGVTSAASGAALSFQPSSSFPGEIITGTEVLGDYSGPFAHNDGGGFAAHFDGGNFADGEINTMTWVFGSDPGAGLYFHPGVSISSIFYTAVDQRAAVDWTNRVYFGFSGGGNSQLIFDRHEGGSGPYGIKAVTESGTSFDISALAMYLDPDVEYWIEWYRPSHSESYAKIWADGDTPPADWQVIALASGSTSPEEPSHHLTAFTSAFKWQQFALAVDVIAAGPDVAISTPGGGAGAGFHPEFPPYFDGITYQLYFAFFASSSQVYVNGLRKRLNIDYTELPSAGKIVFASAKLPTDRIVIYIDPNGAPV